MRLIALYLRHPQTGRLRSGRLLLAAGLGASLTLSGTLVADAIGYGHDHVLLSLIGFGLAAALFVTISTTLNESLSLLLETHIAGVRERVAAALDRLRLPALTALGRETMRFNAFAMVRQVAQSDSLSIRLILNVGTVAWTLAAILIISPTIVVVFLAMLLVLVVGFVYQNAIIKAHLRDAQRHEEEVATGVGNLLDGLQELKMHRPKADAFFATEIKANALACSRVRAAANLQALIIYAAFQVVQFIAVGVCIFGIALLIPRLAEDASEAALLLAFIPIGILRDFPVLSRCDRATRRFEAFAGTLDATSTADGSTAPEPGVKRLRFDSLEMIDVTFTYQALGDDRPFHLGPVSYTFSAGKVHFLTGGNGSGKSTLITLLTGLQRPDGGEFRLNGAPASMEAWGDLFAPVFYDFHLFERLYGRRTIDPAVVEQTLTYLHIADKTGFDAVAGRFTTRMLSTGQKRRLAMAVALLENRPVFVFDEWAADQDPEFREIFYRRILPDLKTAGRTVIAATHDDRYFHLADKLIPMRDGRIDLNNPLFKS